MGCNGSQSVAVEQIEEMGGKVIWHGNEMIIHARHHTGEPGAAAACWGDDDLAKAVPYLQQLSPRTLNLDMTRITDQGLMHLQALSSVRKVTFCTMGGFITDEGLIHFQDMTHLEHLDFSGTRNIRGSGLKHLPQSLRVLSLNFASIDDVSVVHISKLSQLEELNLAETCITDEGLKNLGQLPLRHLRKLDIEGNNISDDGLRFLRGLPALEIIHIGDTQVTREGAKALQAAIPMLIVEGVELNEIQQQLESRK